MNKNQNMRYKALLDSGEYQKGLKRLASEIKTKCQKAENEATVSGYFENSVYYFVKSFFGKEVDFVKEKNVGNSIRHVFSNKRMDAVTHNLIIEYKHSSKLQSEQDIEKATNQIIEYLEMQVNANNDFEAVLTDGIKIKFIYASGNNVKHGVFTNINIKILDQIIQNLLFVNRKKLASSNLANDFKISSQNQISKKLAIALFNSIKGEKISEKTDMLFNEWRDLFHLSESDKGKNQYIDKRREDLNEIFNFPITDNNLEYKALFCLQTTYAIIVKLTALKSLNQITSNNEDRIFDNLSSLNSGSLKFFFQELEDGYTFRNIGIRNLLEGEFFAWYCDDNQWNEDIFKLIKELIDVLNSYLDLKFTKLYEPQDLFKELYLGTIPKSIRHSLGEYFTPSWLADSVIKNSFNRITEKKWRGLDPCCGSGIFLVRLIKNILEDKKVETLSSSEKKILLKDILNRVNGVDLNPLAVLTSRVNYFIAISSLIEGVDDIEIPVYLGDSANTPKIIDIDGVRCYSYDIDTQKNKISIELPASFIENKEFSQIMFSIQTLVKAEKPEEIASMILESLSKKEINDKIKLKINNLAENLVILHKNKWDGIWVRIMYNFLTTVKLGLFDIIVGNPPWVKWEFLPQSYADKIKKLCLDTHLFSGSFRTGGISLNICALISNTVASRSLADKGVLSFLMPRTLMTQQSYEGFRNFYLDSNKQKRLFIQGIDDWSESGHPFITVQEKFLTYFFSSKEVDYSKNGVVVNKYHKKKGVNIIEINAKKDFDSAKKYFDIIKGSAKQLNGNKTNFTFIDKNSKYNFSSIIGDSYYKARSGAEFTPGEIYFLKSSKKSQYRNTHFFNNKILKSAKYKVIPKNNLELETKYIHPLVKGPNVKAFYLKEDNDYAIFPYNWGEKDCVSFGSLNKESRRVSEYLTDYKKLIEQQSKKSLDLSLGKEFYALSKIGKYTFIEHLVVFRDNTEMCATVITSTNTPWGEKKMPVCAKHAPYISMTKGKTPISLDEAHYICGVLNTKIVAEYVLRSNDSRSISIDLPIKLPKFNKRDSNFYQISLLSKDAQKVAKSGGAIDKHIEKIEKLYLKICKYNK